MGTLGEGGVQLATASGEIYSSILLMIRITIVARLGSVVGYRPSRATSTSLVNYFFLYIFFLLFERNVTSKDQIVFNFQSRVVLRMYYLGVMMYPY